MSRLAVPDALEELRGRRIATSEDRPVWLGARAKGVTATEISKLMKGPSAFAGVLKEKREARDIGHVASIRRGREAEPHIVEWILNDQPHLAPNAWLFHAADNVRHLATPDAVGLAFSGLLEAAEVKSTTFDLRPLKDGGDVTAERARAERKKARGKSKFWTTGYYEQCLWQLYVTGAYRVRFVFEPALTSTDFGEPIACWIYQDPEYLAEMVSRADEYLAWSDAQAEEPEPAPVDEEIAFHAATYLAGLRDEQTGKAAKDLAIGALHDRVKELGALSAETDEWSVSYSGEQTEEFEVPDVEAAKAEAPGLWAVKAAADAAWAEVLARHSTRKTAPKARGKVLRVTDKTKKREKAA